MTDFPPASPDPAGPMPQTPMPQTPAPHTPAPHTPAPAFRTRPWIKVVLALSLALNLGIAGMTAGAFLRHGGPPSADRDLGLGPLGDALTREDRKALRKAFVAAHPDLKKGAAALRADFDAVLAALRAQPFDPAALDAALATVALRNADRLETARGVIAGYLKAMPPEARAAFADRLEKTLSRAEKRDRWRRDQD